MKNISLEELLEAGCHFGHQVTRHNHKTADFVFEARDGIHIIDLEKTKEYLDKAYAFAKSIASGGEDTTLLILGSKRQAQEIVREESERALKETGNGIYTVTARWIGGTLTNHEEVSKNYKKLEDLTAKLVSKGERAKFTKKEVSLWEKEKQKLELYYKGTVKMLKMPSLIFVIDTHLENLAVKEARVMGIPVVGIVDTNADPDPVTHPIPANDDAVGSIKLITHHIIDAWIEGKSILSKSKDGESGSSTDNGEDTSSAGKVKKVKAKTKVADEGKI